VHAYYIITAKYQYLCNKSIGLNDG